jgi:hypothetical protein
MRQRARAHAGGKKIGRYGGSVHAGSEQVGWLAASKLGGRQRARAQAGGKKIGRYRGWGELLEGVDQIARTVKILEAVLSSVFALSVKHEGKEPSPHVKFGRTVSF